MMKQKINFNFNLELILKIAGIVLVFIGLYQLLKILPQIFLVGVFAGAGIFIFPDKALIKKNYKKIGGSK